MEPKTIVRVGDHLAELTGLGWKSTDLETAFFCDYASRQSYIPMPFYLNPQRAAAEHLLAVCRRRRIDAEIISLGGVDQEYSDPDNPNMLF